MSCPKKDKWILFYYRELKPQVLKAMNSHIQECSCCQKEYRALEVSLSQLKSEPVDLSNQEILEIINKAKTKLALPSFIDELKARIADAGENFRLHLSYRPRLVPIALVVTALCVFLPFAVRQRQILNREFDILQIQLELSLENSDVSMFELYEETPSYLDDLSGSRQHTLNIKPS